MQPEAMAHASCKFKVSLGELQNLGLLLGSSWVLVRRVTSSPTKDFDDFLHF